MVAQCKVLIYKHLLCRPSNRYILYLLVLQRVTLYGCKAPPCHFYSLQAAFVKIKRRFAKGTEHLLLVPLLGFTDVTDIMAAHRVQGYVAVKQIIECNWPISRVKKNRFYSKEWKKSVQEVTGFEMLWRSLYYRNL